MQKRWLIPVLATTLVLGIAVTATAANNYRNIAVNYPGITIKVDGKAVQSGDSTPFIVVNEGRTYIPARYLAEALGAKVEWDGPNETVVVSTPRFVSAATSGTTTTYSFPYYGASMALPSSGVRQSDSSTLLDVALTDALVQVQVVDLPAGATFDLMTKTMIGAFQNAAQFAATSQTDLTLSGDTAARDVSGTIELNGVSATMNLRFIQDKAGHLWTISVIPNPGTKLDTARLQSLFSGFHLPA